MSIKLNTELYGRTIRVGQVSGQYFECFTKVLKIIYLNYFTNNNYGVMI